MRVIFGIVDWSGGNELSVEEELDACPAYGDHVDLRGKHGQAARGMVVRVVHVVGAKKTDNHVVLDIRRFEYKDKETGE
jgi:hypothetical protein